MNCNTLVGGTRKPAWWYPLIPKQMNKDGEKTIWKGLWRQNTEMKYQYDKKWTNFPPKGVQRAKHYYLLELTARSQSFNEIEVLTKALPHRKVHKWPLSASRLVLPIFHYEAHSSYVWSILSSNCHGLVSKNDHSSVRKWFFIQFLFNSSAFFLDRFHFRFIFLYIVIYAYA